MTTEAVPNAIYDSQAGMLWLLTQPHNATARRLVDRLGCWIKMLNGDLVPDVDGIAQAVIQHDAYMDEWRAYCDRSPAPHTDSDAVYERWENAGPPCPSAARVIGPMSSGEKRMVRMLAALSTNDRVEFSISDLDGIDSEFRRDWRRLVAGEDWGR